MAERPDLDAIGNDLMEEIQDLANKSVASICRIQDLLAYCRELETENKQLRETADEDSRRHANWLAAAGDCGP